MGKNGLIWEPRVVPKQDKQLLNSRQQEKILDTLKKIRPDEEAKDRKRKQDKNNSKQLDSRLEKISFLDRNRFLPWWICFLSARAAIAKTE